MSDGIGQEFSLASAREVVGFFSYSREDDDDSFGRLSALRDAIQRELRVQLGRTRQQLRLWQDREAIVPGRLWEQEIRAAIAHSLFFIPIITPTVVKSRYCGIEFEAFLEREQQLGRSDLVFPILYVRVPEFEIESVWRNHPVLSVIGQRQWSDWRNLRLLSVDDLAVRQAVEQFCGNIFSALRLPTVMPGSLSRQEQNKEASPDSERARRPTGPSRQQGPAAATYPTAIPDDENKGYSDSVNVNNERVTAKSNRYWMVLLILVALITAAGGGFVSNHFLTIPRDTPSPRISAVAPSGQPEAPPQVTVAPSPAPSSAPPSQTTVAPSPAPSSAPPSQTTVAPSPALPQSQTAVIPLPSPLAPSSSTPAPSEPPLSASLAPGQTWSINAKVNNYDLSGKLTITDRTADNELNGYVEISFVDYRKIFTKIKENARIVLSINKINIYCGNVSYIAGNGKYDADIFNFTLKSPTEAVGSDKAYAGDGGSAVMRRN